MPPARAAALLAAGVLAVHELRYLLGRGDQATEAAAGGHAYLPLAAVAVAVALAAAAARFLHTVVRARRTGNGGRAPSPSFVGRWAGSTAVLVCAYLVQETLEGALTGSADVLHTLVGHGGWTAFVVAVFVGALIALLERGAGAALRAATRRHRAPARRRPSQGARLPAAAAQATPAAPLARHLGRRAPPAGSRA